MIVIGLKWKFKICNFCPSLYVFFESTEVDIQLMEVLKECTQRCALGHHGKGVDILRETLTAIAKLAVRPWDVGVGVVDVA